MSLIGKEGAASWPPPFLFPMKGWGARGKQEIHPTTSVGAPYIPRPFIRRLSPVYPPFVARYYTLRRDIGDLSGGFRGENDLGA